MIQLIIGLVAAAAIAGVAYKMWDGFKTSIAAPYVQAQIAADQPKITAAEKRADEAEKLQADAEGERNRARADTALCVAASMAQSKEVDKWKATSDANVKAAREARDRASREATAAAPRIAELQARAAAAPQLMACTEELSKAKDTLRQALRVRRGLPAVPIAAPPAKAPDAPVLVK